MADAERNLADFIGILDIEGSAEELISEMRHTPEERADLQAAPGINRIIRLDELIEWQDQELAEES